MATIFRTATVNNKINRRTLFKDDIRRLELIRNRVEKPQDQKRFLSILQQAAKEAGYDDVKVELLSVEDAFFHGCKGLYKERKGHATVAIPMSYYGTTRLLSLPEAFEILAHELGHHETRKAKTDHDLDHTIATEEIGAKLKGLTTGRDYKVRRVDGPLVSYEKKKWKRNDNLLKLTMFISTLLLAGIGGFSLYQAAQQRGMIDDLTAEVAKVTKGLDSFVNSKTPSKAAPEAPFRPSRKDKRSHE